MNKLQVWLLAVLGCALVSAAVWLLRSVPPPAWSDAEITTLRSLWIDSLPDLPDDPSNAVGADPRAAEFGWRLFFDTRLSANGAIACATCHQPSRAFTDGRARGQALGESPRNTRNIIGAAYSPWQYWDGRKDSLWSQALSPLEDAAEHGGNRMQYVRLMVRDGAYRASYETLFGALPDLSDNNRFAEAAAPAGSAEAIAAWQSMSAADRRTINRVFSNIGKALAAYQRLLVPGAARFDSYVAAVIEADTAAQVDTFTTDEVWGLRLFIGKARCTECHNGPLFTNNEFHNTGILSLPGELPDRGRAEGLRQVLNDRFNCRGEFSDDPAADCPELLFARSGKELLGAMRTPTLRNLEGTDPFMHKGQLPTIAAVLEHYNHAPLAMIGHNEAEPLRLSRRELAQIEAFLATLSGPVAVSPDLLQAP
ncbi:MAG: cytochrome c peroxidase [Woeseia sp.]